MGFILGEWKLNGNYNLGFRVQGPPFLCTFVAQTWHLGFCRCGWTVALPSIPSQLRTAVQRATS